jgi:hypothetical protein
LDVAIAILFAVVGLADSKVNYCDEPGGCFAKSETTPELSLSFGNGIFQEETINDEYYVRYEFNHKFGPFQPSLGVSNTTTGDFWLGFGNTVTKPILRDRMYFRFSNLAGIYAQGTGPDLGSYLEFRSSVELGYKWESGVKVGLSYDHRSNADISTLNPGFETVQLRMSFPLGQKGHAPSGVKHSF